MTKVPEGLWYNHSEHPAVPLGQRIKNENMEKRKYEKPMLISEAFIPNEYVAACWYIACDYGNGENNHWDPYHFGDENYKHAANPNGTGCGHANNQHIYDLPNGGFSITEENTDGLNNLKCTITNGVTSVGEGTFIQWTTTSGDRTWTHKGTVHLFDQSRPNHS